MRTRLGQTSIMHDPGGELRLCVCRDHLFKMQQDYATSLRDTWLATPKKYSLIYGKK